ncbi:MAG TPA: DUF6288 domain-containing protein, partial [Luteolibacter sp.]|nr:DUF6288 domain-containing protein [Luteolibacter sp.]
DWNLGPTGARGWVYGWAGNTSEARQILVTAVAAGTPADGVLQAGDVILGVGGKAFDGDARIQFGKAITAAEEKKNGGALKLTRWRAGQSESVVVPLKVMGCYSATAPYDCAKSKAIFEQGCAAIAKRGLKGVSIPNNLNAMALLASGKAEYQPLLAAYAKEAAALQSGGMQSWIYGHTTLFLAEYVAATHDPEATAGLQRLASEVARGQSAVGTWGHSFALPSGNCKGYGCMNLPGLGLLLGMQVAREAGLKDPAVDQAITKSAAFLRWYVDKGAIPYGDHQPWPGHEDNGKCSAAAILFDLLGDKEATTYYAKMSIAAYAERERGHTGNFYNMLWALPGVSRGGPLATSAYLQETSWYYDLARGADGSFGYQGSPAGEEEHGKYKSWDCTGAYLLSYALQNKSLLVTGKKPCSIAAFDAKTTAAVIAAGRDYSSATKNVCYDGHSAEQLLAELTSWSPAVRKRAAHALGKREGDVLPKLLTMLAGPDRHTRYGACEAIGCLGARGERAAPQLQALLTNEDPWLQSLACASLSQLGPEARRSSIEPLLRLMVSGNPADPRGMVQRAASAALFAPYPGSGGPKGILADGLDGVDRKLLYPAMRAAMQNQDGVARASVAAIYGKLNEADLKALMPSMLPAVEKLAPSNEMFADGIRLSSLELMAKLHIREGLPLCLSVIEADRWGSGKRLPGCLKSLALYGSHAQAYLPQLQELRKTAGKSPENAALIDQVIAQIESAKDTPPLVPLAEFSR